VDWHNIALMTGLSLSKENAAMTKLYPVTMNLSATDLEEAIRMLVRKRGLVDSENLRLVVLRNAPDRPWDSETFEFSVTGVYVKAPNHES
jgi:hypothetical protein